VVLKPQSILFFKSYIASYVGPIQTGFLMTLLSRFWWKKNHDSCEKNTGTKKQEFKGFLQELPT
jgi:hypothetical protein